MGVGDDPFSPHPHAHVRHWTPPTRRGWATRNRWGWETTPPPPAHRQHPPPQACPPPPPDSPPQRPALHGFPGQATGVDPCCRPGSP